MGLKDQNIPTRGFAGLISRVITRGFGGIFKSQVFKKKKKLPFYKEFNFDIYIPIRKKIELEKEIKINLFKKLFLSYLINTKIKKEIDINKDFYVPISKNFEINYSLNQKVDNKKLINILNVLLDDIDI